MPGDPFDITFPEAPLSRAALNAARPLLETALDLKILRATYQRVREMKAGSFAGRVLQSLEITTDTRDFELARLPADGPVVIAANHPHGALDGLVLAAAVERVRPDVRLLANRLLARVPELRDLCFFVDPFGGRGAASRSRAGLRAALDWLRNGHVLIVFPAGEVAHRAGTRQTRTDSPWLDTFARLAAAARADVVPAFIQGSNSSLFYAAGRLHPLLRTALLPRELARSRGRRVRIAIAEPVSRPSTPSRSAVEHVAAAARAAVDRMHSEQGYRAETLPPLFTEPEIASEVEALPADACLVESGRFAVYCAPASSIPRTLDEIGRLRELTYRAVGEGTGCSRDLDRFDAYYTHLFVWDRPARRLVGAYRIGDVTRIVSKHGVAGLYTRQLFRYDQRLIGSMGPALELGRSWVRSEYQRHSNALLMLWRGIGRYVVERSNARVLFGPVSISARYSDATHELLRAFLTQNHRHDALAEMVEAVCPAVAARSSSLRGENVTVPRTIAEADALVGRLEADGKGVPVLLRQYLKLNARLIGFNIDPSFGDALDALMMVDLADVEPSVLTRYLGGQAARAVSRIHLAA